MTRIYGIEHAPLMATIRRNRRDSSKSVAFIGPQLCFLERSSVVPDEGAEVEVMITRAVYGTHPVGHRYQGSVDHGSLRALMVEVVDPARHVLVAIDGFECAGTMCRTTASGRVTDGKSALTSEDVWNDMSERRGTGRPRTVTVTPGRTDVHETMNVNTPYGQPKRELRPTNVWIDRALAEERGWCMVRIAGLTRVEDGAWARLVRTAPVRRAA